MDIKDLNLAELIVALYERAGKKTYPPGNAAGVTQLLAAMEGRTFTKKDAQKLIDYAEDRDIPVSLDYIRGRALKVYFEDGNLFRADLYDRDHGENACQEVIDLLRS